MSVRHLVLTTVLAMSILKTVAALIYQGAGHVLVKMVIFLTERMLVQFRATVCTKIYQNIFTHLSQMDLPTLSVGQAIFNVRGVV